MVVIQQTIHNNRLPIIYQFKHTRPTIESTNEKQNVKKAPMYVSTQGKQTDTKWFFFCFNHHSHCLFLARFWQLCANKVIIIICLVTTNMLPGKKSEIDDVENQKKRIKTKILRTPLTHFVCFCF